MREILQAKRTKKFGHLSQIKPTCEEIYDEFQDVELSSPSLEVNFSDDNASLDESDSNIYRFESMMLERMKRKDISDAIKQIKTIPKGSNELNLEQLLDKKESDDINTIPGSCTNKYVDPVSLVIDKGITMTTIKHKDEESKDMYDSIATVVKHQTRDRDDQEHKICNAREDIEYSLSQGKLSTEEGIVTSVVPSCEQLNFFCNTPQLKTVAKDIKRAKTRSRTCRSLSAVYNFRRPQRQRGVKKSDFSRLKLISN